MGDRGYFIFGAVSKFFFEIVHFLIVLLIFLLFRYEKSLFRKVFFYRIRHIEDRT